MAIDIGKITTSQTFQNWFNKTNDLVDALADNVVTASPGGDTTTGSATLTGTITAANVVGSTKVSTDTIQAVTSNASVNFVSPLQVTGAAQTTSTFLFAAGPQTRYSTGTLSWDVGLEDANPGAFIIDTGTGDPKFKLSTAGTLTVPDATVTGTLTVGTLSIGSGGGGLSTDDISEGSTNLYFTDARARGVFSGGDGINIATDGTISFDGEGELNTYKGNEFITTGSVSGDEKAFITGKRLINVPFGVLNSNWSGTDYEVLTWGPSGINVNGYGYFNDDVQVRDGDVEVYSGSTKVAQIDQSGNGIFLGDVTTNGSFSDERLKENIVPLEKGLDTLEQIKTYTFNYKDGPQDTHPGVIAQELEQLVPEVVYDIEMEDDTYKAVRYQQLVPILIKAIQDLSEKVNVLENKLENKE
jgi:hypothetical protein